MGRWFRGGIVGVWADRNQAGDALDKGLAAREPQWDNSPWRLT